MLSQEKRRDPPTRPAEERAQENDVFLTEATEPEDENTLPEDAAECDRDVLGSDSDEDDEQCAEEEESDLADQTRDSDRRECSAEAEAERCDNNETREKDGTDFTSAGGGGSDRVPPTEVAAAAALADIREILRPHRNKGRGYKDPGISLWTRERFEEIRTFLTHYTSPNSPSKGAWIAASLVTANGVSKSGWHARQLRSWARAFIGDRSDIPTNPYGSWNISWLDENDLSEEIQLHLQSIGKYVRAMDMVHYLDRPEVKERLRMKKTISLATAKRWMKKVGYRWTKNFKGQYVDGHERDDVVFYRQNVFLPKWVDVEARTRRWTETNQEIAGPRQGCRPLVVWFHDESTFYANDRRTAQWVHKDATPVPYAKGEGASLMVADFVSADYGWLRSRDETEATRVLFKAGKNREGYFTSDDILAQAEKAMDILSNSYPDEDHVLVFDNATTHLKRADDALSARKMPKYTPKVGTNWGVEVTVKDTNGQIVYGADGKPSKTKVRMADGKFADGSPQAFYFPLDHPRAGVFKGMATILEERGLGDMTHKRAECKGFKCEPTSSDCCCRRILYSQPDFSNTKSLLETACEARGFKVLFLPKFHCELNFIEQCWGHAKREYRLKPPSSKEVDLQDNVVHALNAISVEQMRRYSRRSCRFMDAYRKGLTGRQAAWAGKKYHGHRVLPATLMDDLEHAKQV
ncbi:hypothetical protein PLICRDRAFT_112639 [Plicaturopsis crispa FD-325 SS-3]|nr:hypothetical protein PLICRDRAFT_112639 [Plicaturopsis crispa FD-325 SS-3]